jgi:hypothetical protein
VWSGDPKRLLNSHLRLVPQANPLRHLKRAHVLEDKKKKKKKKKPMKAPEKANTKHEQIKRRTKDKIKRVKK